MGELFPDRLDASARSDWRSIGAAVDVPDDRAFTGLDAYQKVIASRRQLHHPRDAAGLPPGAPRGRGRAGKHIFTEKPVAVDGPGIRTCLSLVDVAGAEEARWSARHAAPPPDGYLETMKRIHDGAIGDIVAARCYWNQGALWNRGRKPEWTDIEWQLRNWSTSPGCPATTSSSSTSTTSTSSTGR